MPTLTQTFDAPRDILEGLLSGRYQLNGGVIQQASGAPTGGNIVTWIRPITASPLTSQVVTTALGAARGVARAAEALGTVGAIASVVNLGATIAFGVATLAKLKRIEGEIDHLRWHVAPPAPSSCENQRPHPRRLRPRSSQPSSRVSSPPMPGSR